MRRYYRYIYGVIILISMFSCSERSDKTLDGRTIVTYWEKWTGFEGEAMQAVVDSFNASQDSIYVEKLTVSKIYRKVLVATAGGDPPDVAGLASFNIPAFADNCALTPLDSYMAEYGVSYDAFVDVFIDMCRYKGTLWGVPSTPSTIALHWNKTLFRQAGLDPHVPPKTIAELDSFAELLTKVDEDGVITQLGFLPGEPLWWPWAWGFWFGGRLWDGVDKVTIDSPENLRMLEWVASYSKKYGIDALKRFQSGFGSFSSPQNPFFCGLLAMELQGVWMHNFIDRYAPSMEWGVAPFPSAVPGRDSVTLAESDILVIPRGARHPDEAFAFIAYVSSQKGLELLNIGQRKASPLKEQSASYRKNHQHPHIELFANLAKSRAVCIAPKTGIVEELRREMRVAFERVMLLQAEPADVLKQQQKRMQRSLDRLLKQVQRREQQNDAN